MRQALSRFVVVLVLMLCSAIAGAQPESPRIGVLTPQANSPYEASLRDGLRELGYIDGKNLVIEWRRFTGAEEQLRSLAADLVQTNVDVIVAVNTPSARAVLKATTSIPVVFLSGDPVASGLAASLAKAV